MLKVLFEGGTYEVQLVNQGFDQKKYSGHSDVLQIRYPENGSLAVAIRNKFESTLNMVSEFRSNPANKGKQLKLKEAEATKWLTKETLDSVSWLPADQDLVEIIKKTF